MKKLLRIGGYIVSLLLIWSIGYAETTESTETVDINTADAYTIAHVLDGVGEKKAAAIVQYREEHGPFKSIADLENVYGIGGKTIEKNVDKIVISQPTDPEATGEQNTAKTPEMIPMNDAEVETAQEM